MYLTILVPFFTCMHLPAMDSENQMKDVAAYRVWGEYAIFIQGKEAKGLPDSSSSVQAESTGFHQILYHEMKEAGFEEPAEKTPYYRKIERPWTQKQQDEIDTLVDAEAFKKCPKPKKAYIHFGGKGGRTLAYAFDGSDDFNYDQYWYGGPADIKSERYNPELWKPHAFYDEVKEVTEDGYVVSPFVYIYPMKTVTYQDGTKTERFTLHHRNIQMAKGGLSIGLSLGCLYTAFSIWKWVRGN